MAFYIGKRILLMLLLLLGMSFIVFISLFLTPGDPAAMVGGASATEEDIANIRIALGLDQPFLIQYGRYLKNLLTLNLGVSFTSRQPIAHELAVRLPYTLNLAMVSIIISILVGIPGGIITALKRDTPVDNALTTLSLIGVSIPNFWLGTLLILLFSVTLRWLPSGGMTHFFWTPKGLSQVIMPAIALSTATVANFTRLGRNAMLEVLQSDYIRTARSKGLKGRTVIVIHALRNALIPLVTQFGTSFGLLLSGAIVTEQVFVVNGIGSYLIDAINKRNYPVVQSTVMLIAGMFVLVNLAVDIVYCVIDPRIKYN
jgi:peptide/nickel transport system permease protein